MKIFLLLLPIALMGQPKPAASPKPAPPEAKEMARVTPVQAAAPAVAKGESLHYNVNWPSGLSLGEAELTTSAGESSLHFSFQMDASIPGFAVSESAKSRATAGFCSEELTKKGTRGSRKVDERTEFDAAALKATRTTQNGGGKSELSISPCAKDALTFISFLRKELAAGRLPAQQKVYYGGAYSVRVAFTGTQRILIGGQGVEADKLTAAIKGSTSEINADFFFAKDAKRTLLLVQAPLAIGKFSMELAR